MQARPRPGSAVPPYPEALRLRKIEGTVVFQFKVDSTGRVDIASARVLKSSDPAFALSVYRTLPAMRFLPAQRNGKNVNEIVQQPYDFSLNR